MVFQNIEVCCLAIASEFLFPRETIKNRFQSKERKLIQTKEFMEPILPLMENKGVDNELFLDNASELLFSLVEKARTILIKDFKKPILDIFLGNVDNHFYSGILQVFQASFEILVENH